MVRRVLLLCLIAVLTACGSQGQAAAPTALPTPTPAGTSPEAVHAAWVGAMRGNDRDTLRSLAAPMEFQTAFVDDNLTSVQDIISSQKFGALQGVDIQPVTDAENGKIGISVWTFADHTSCYRTTMTNEAGAWKVRNWGTVKRCPDVAPAEAGR